MLTSLVIWVFWFTVGGSFAECTNTLAGQARKAIFMLNRYLSKFVNVPVKQTLDLFDKLIMPVLHYGSEVWGFTIANAIERVHLSFCKRLLGVKQSTQNDFVYGELGRTSLIVNRHVSIIKLWLNVCDRSNTKYTKLTYDLLVSDTYRYPTKINWASLVRDLLYNLGLGHAWIHQGVGDIRVFLSLVKQRINDQFLQNWYARLGTSSRALFYIKYRTVLF